MKYAKITKKLFLLLTISFLVGSSLFISACSGNEIEPLPAPVIMKYSDNSVCWNAIEGVDGYIISDCGVEQGLQTSTFYAAHTENGTYIIKVKAKRGEQYSDFSEEIIYSIYPKTTYKVIFPAEQIGYQIIGETICEGKKEYHFSISLDDLYDMSNYVVKINGEAISGNNGHYTVANVSSNLEITVEGVHKNVITADSAGIVQKDGERYIVRGISGLDVCVSVSDDFVARSIGKNNVVTLKMKAKSASSSENDEIGKGDGQRDHNLWWKSGEAYVFSGINDQWLSKDLRVTEDFITIRLPYIQGETPHFLLKSFDGVLEITDIYFEHLEADVNYDFGLTEVTHSLRYGEDGLIREMNIEYQTDSDFSLNSASGLSSEYINHLIAEGKQFLIFDVICEEKAELAAQIGDIVTYPQKGTFTIELKENTAIRICPTGSGIGYRESVIIQCSNFSYDLQKANNSQLKILSPDVEDSPVYLYADNIKEFLEAPTDADAINYGSAVYKANKTNAAQAIDIIWTNTLSDTESVTVFISENADYSNAITVAAKANANKVSIYNLKKNTLYYVKVSVTVKSSMSFFAEASFRTADLGPRPLQIDGIHNVRDVGGYQTDSGETLQNMIFRGGQLCPNPTFDGVYASIELTEEGKKYMSEVLKIKTEIDLRGANSIETNDMDGNPITESVIPGATLMYIMVGGYKDAFKPYLAPFFKELFSVLSNPDNYPIYIHCTGGADRTGTVCFLLNAFLGVSEKDLIKDYEMTSFSYYDYRSSTSGVYASYFQEFRAELERFNGDTLAEKAKGFLLSIGLTETQLEMIRSNMIAQPSDLVVSIL